MIRRGRLLRQIAKSAKVVGYTDMVEQVRRVQEAKEAAMREHLKDVLFQIEADRLARHQDIRQLLAEIEEGHKDRRTEIDRIKTEVHDQMDEYAADSKVWRGAWREYQAMRRQDVVDQVARHIASCAGARPVEDIEMPFLMSASERRSVLEELVQAGRICQKGDGLYYPATQRG